MSNAAFSQLCDEFVDTSFRLEPVMATMAGVHEYDSELGDPSLGALRRRVDWLRQLNQRLDTEVDEAALESYDRIDFAYLRSRIRSALILYEGQREAERNPVLYPDNCMYGFFLLFTRDFAPLKDRLEPLLKRLERSGTYLETARETVNTCPRIFGETAVEVSRAAIEFIEEIRSKLVEEFPKKKKRIESACKKAVDAFAGYADWIETDLLPKANDAFAIGRKLFDARLRDEHLLPYDSESLEKLGWELLRQLQEEMDRVADEVKPGQGWRKVVEASRRDHPPADGVLDAYRSEVERARTFIVDRRLAPIPESEELQVIDTPDFERSRIPYAAYLEPGPFDKVQKGSFYVTAVDPDSSHEEQEATLVGHNTHALPICALHEAYPGHHLQLCWANRAKSRLRKLGDSTVLAEGWALYCEEMMYEEGFYRGPLERLFQLKDSSWRAARVIIDCRLHTGKMSSAEAVDFLVDEAMLERPNAEAEVRRYAETPTQPMSYAVGKRALLDLRDEVRGKLGDAFDLHDFHAAVLQAGTIPVGLVRQEVLERLELGVA
jgi:uncharacterized protein (DUF885 family)